MDHERLQATVVGRVQGVCFRHYTRLRAKELNLTGWVRNESDGSVRVVAEGPRGDLDQLVEFLQHGPDQARVSNLSTSWQSAQGDLSPFSVGH